MIKYHLHQKKEGHGIQIRDRGTKDDLSWRLWGRPLNQSDGTRIWMIIGSKAAHGV